jgi:NAD-dependent SIR2 family protein deacetylase
MSKLFILGAGFSKAFSCYMPILHDFGQYIIDKINELPGDSEDRMIYRKLSPDFEQLLTYLFQAMPWKSPEKVLLDRSVFSTISRFIADYVTERQRLAFANSTPPWGDRFVRYIAAKELTVATLNYDTILEELYLNWQIPDKTVLGPEYAVQQITILDLYPLPVINLLERKLHPYISSEGVATFKFKLLKLHGSINWYYAGDENTPSQQVYAEDYATVSRHRNTLEKLKMDLVPLIIPPITEKTPFYGTNLVKTAWISLQQAIKEADEIYCVGYSLPKTDLTMKLFLSTAVNTYNRKKVYIVNNSTGKALDDLLENYSEVFGERNLRKKYLGWDNCVEKMVNDLISGY